MKMDAIISKVSQLYRESLKKEEECRLRKFELTKEYREIEEKKSRHLPFMHELDVLRELDEAEKMLEKAKAYSDGIGIVREMLMDLDFDTEVEK